MIERSIKTGRPQAHRAEWEAELYATPCPPALAYLWSVYSRIRGRTGAGMAANPISLGDIESFVRLLRLPLAPWEIECLEDIDNLFMKSAGDAIRAAAAAKPSST